ncbi:RNA helicase required for poly(A+) mRNA export [Microbotryomycetes sp. JL201]|nr:RNA helicase required for poly(A+) mRNA export [Microbotryomycetes sp. JL201]
MSDAVNSLSSRLAELKPADDSAPQTNGTADGTKDSQQATAADDSAQNGKAEDEAGEELQGFPKVSSLLTSLTNEVQVTLADQQADPDSPLYSAKSFEDLNLHPNLLKGVYRMGFQKPSKIQERALPLLLQNPPRNMIGQSQSGTGKTAAFVLTMLSRIDLDLKAPQAICIVPSRELALQILDVVTQMGQYTPVECFHAGRDTISRGMPKVQAQIIVGTPGTIIDASTFYLGVLMVTKSRVLDLKDVKVFVLDEADNMLDQGTMGDQSVKVKKYVTFKP